jgi:ABC-type dipeptide/oligopeptide/nickel transport system permease component
MSKQVTFIARRVLLTIPTLFAMSIIVFLIIRLVPGDPVRTMLGFRATDENVAELRRQLGLDQSLLHKMQTGSAHFYKAIWARTSSATRHCRNCLRNAFRSPSS